MSDRLPLGLDANYWYRIAKQWMAIRCRCGHALNEHHTTAGWCEECDCKHFIIKDVGVRESA